MVVLISFTLLVVAAIAMLVIRLIRPNFGYHWLIAAVGGFTAWGMVLGLGLRLPIRIALPAWGLGEISSNSILLLADRTSWPFAVGIVTIFFAAILTDVVRAIEIDWSNWASSLLMTSLGLIAVFAANLLTFVLIWTAVDVIGFVLLLLQVNENKPRRNLVMRFFARLLGTSFLVLAGVISLSQSPGSTLVPVTSSAFVFIVLAATLRLGILPESSPILDRRVHRRSFGTVMRLVSSGMVFLFLVRSAQGVPEIVVSGFLWLILISSLIIMALISGASWILAKDELNGRQAFLTGMGAIVIAAVLRSQPAAGMAWGLAGMFSGGLLFLASVRTRVSLWITLLGALGLFALPYTPAWNSSEFFSNPITVSLFFFFIAMVFVVWGYIRHAFVTKPFPEGIERWIRVVYPVGLGVLPLTHFALGWFLRPDLDQISSISWILGPLITILAVLGFLWQRRGVSTPKVVSDTLSTVISLGWLFAFIRLVFSYVERMINFITKILEGEGGFLWVLLWIVLFLAVLVIGLGT
jgi:hypothetical protein